MLGEAGQAGRLQQLPPRMSGSVNASRIFPLDVACSGVSSPTQLCAPTAEGPRAWSTFTA